MIPGNGYSNAGLVLLERGSINHWIWAGFGVNVDGPSLQRRGKRTWSVSENVSQLVMAFDATGTVRYTLSARQASNEIGMNGQRWFVQAQTVCR